MILEAHDIKSCEVHENELDKNSVVSRMEITAPDKYKSHRTDKKYIDVCNKIKKTFDRCITKNSDVLQGCVWRINLYEVEKIEILKDDGHVYGSLNYIRSNGKRIDWQKDYYKLLK